MTFISKKAFTLIELLVVVAIIGILAAVGVTTFNGFQEKAKVSATKKTYSSLIRYVNAEMMKCTLGETKAFSNHLACSNLSTSNQVSQSATRALRTKYKNPYNTNEEAIYNGNIYDCKLQSYNGNQSSAGRVYIYDNGSTYWIRGCTADNATMMEYSGKVE